MNGNQLISTTSHQLANENAKNVIDIQKYYVKYDCVYILDVS